MTAKQKLGNLQHQINQAEMGLTTLIVCPYCKEQLDFSGPGALDTDWKPPSCCADFALATIAILQRKEQAEMKELADRIHSNAGGLAVFN